ncbi:hypothetical protein Acsp03_23160 [Actinomadura sp. NBRC 104412]|uniref:hypothetical protein n=1 Tax=Actinomadura sp. NBRC 104412 TaxID=3032203 RepID=UPI0024A2493D|nr:hypothetical protein [Actinomadura sp. NBRC 104412]GLZ04850.1 hypothetical protein Acsp03_23160 [Actinomadura sp. NBRC 104412]
MGALLIELARNAGARVIGAARTTRKPARRGMTLRTVQDFQQEPSRRPQLVAKGIAGNL